MESAGIWGAVLVLISLPGLLAPREVWSATAAFNYRTPERVVPSNRRFRVARMGSGTLVLMGAVFVVGAVWPGDARAKALAIFWAAIIGILLFIGIVIVSVVRRKRLAAAERELPPDEPSDFAYGTEYISIVIYLVLLLVIGIMLLGFAQQLTAQERLEAADKPLSEQDQKIVDESAKSFNTVHLSTYPVYTELPEGGTLALARSYSPVDADAREPRVIWEQSEESGSGVSLSDADLVLSMSGFSCTVTGLVVQETETTVAVGFVVANPPDEGTTTAKCFSPVLHSDYYPIDLASPLGDRDVVQYGGDRSLILH